MKTLIALFILALTGVQGQPVVRGSYAAPPNAELDRFPVMPRPLTTDQQANLGLQAEKLQVPVVVLNHFREVRGGRFVLETLPAGTTVLSDKGGKIRYKADCGNRISALPSCHAAPVTTGTTGSGSGSASPLLDNTTGSNPGAWDRFWDALGKGWGNTWEFLGGSLGYLLPLLLLLGLLGLIGYLIYRAIQDRRRPVVVNQVVDQRPPVDPGVAPRRGTLLETQPVPPPPQAAATAAGAGLATGGTTPQPAQATVPNINERGEFIRATDAPPRPQQTQPTEGGPPPVDPGQLIFEAGEGRKPTLLRFGKRISRVEHLDIGDGTEVRFFVRK